ncbi:MAG: DNA polymerase III subunit delta [Aggregatilineales bacterium]
MGKTKASPQLITYYVLHGDDEFSRKAEVTAMHTRMGNSPEAMMNIVRLDGSQTSISAVLAAARSTPFLSDKRLVIVEGLLTWLTRRGAGKDARADLEGLLVALPILPDWARVIFHEPGKLPDTHPIFRLIQTDSRGFVKEFKPLSEDKAVAWIANRIATEQATIEPAAARQLVTLVGPDLRALETEIVKLTLYTNRERVIKEADVTLLVSGAPESNMFQFVDMISAQNGRGAITMLHRLLDARQEPLAILGMINRQSRLLLQVKSHVESGGDVRELARLMNVKDWLLNNLLKQAARFPLDRLETMHRTLLDIDYRIKTGQIDGILALDTLVAEWTS